MGCVYVCNVCVYVCMGCVYVCTVCMYVWDVPMYVRYVCMYECTELKDDWETIAQRVGPQKDVAACVLKFLSLPLEKELSGR